MKKVYKYEGMTIANIRVISYDKDDYYNCECIDCLEKYSVEVRRLRDAIVKKSKKFRCNRTVVIKKNSKTVKVADNKQNSRFKHIDPEFKGLSLKYNAYRYRHSKRFKTPIISQSSFYEIITKPCYYCGKMPSIVNFKSGNYIYKSLSSTIDRIDSSKGYEPDNCLSCCNECNTMKSNLSYSDFIQHITNIYDHIYKNQKEKYLIKEVC